MKSILLLFVSVLSIVATTYGQASIGYPVAHWSMNGNANDVSGNGHDGTMYNVTPTAGANGQSNTALYFSGNQSYITVPYSAAFNLSKYTICAMVKVQGYNTGLCQESIILQRGTNNNSGSYCLDLNNNSFDSSCSTYDTTKYVFTTGCVPTNNTNAFFPCQYSPTVTKSVWYCVVATFDSNKSRIYINDTLKSTLNVNPADVIGSSTEGISIGMNTFGNSVTYPYPFNGVIDDIRLYNRVLSDSEIINFCSPATLAVNNEVSLINRDLDIYPNPAQSVLHINSHHQACTLIMIDQLGMMVKKYACSGNGCTIDISDLPPSVYYLQATYNDAVRLYKVIKL
jgi:hypothetical protein